MSRRSSRNSALPYYSKANGREEQEDEHRGNETSSCSLLTEPIAVAAISEATPQTSRAVEAVAVRGLSWTDHFFEEHGDIVAVFDYDHSSITEIKINETMNGPSSAWWPCLLISSSGLGCFIALLNEKFLLATGFALLILTYYQLVVPVRRQVLRRRFEECSDSLRPHTAVTRSGVRHVQPSSPKQQSHVLDIPFEDIVSIKIHAMSKCNLCKVCLTLASKDDGFEYITSGYYPFPTVAGQTQLTLIALKEPARFKKTILAMKDKFSLSTPTSKGAQLLSRLEACLENVHSPNTSDLEVNQVLIKLVDEMREFNKVYSVRGVAIV